MAPFQRPSTRSAARPGRLLAAGVLGTGLSLSLALVAAAEPVLARDDGPAARAAAPTSPVRPASRPDTDTDTVTDTDAGARQAARTFVEEGTDLLGPGSGPGAGEALEVASTTEGADGVRYVAYERTLHGLPVVGGDAVVVVAGSGKVIGWTAARGGPITVGSVVPTVGAGVAQAQARARVDHARRTSEPRLVVHALAGSPRLAWQTRVSGVLDGLPSDQTVWTDAGDGELLGADDRVAHGSGRGYYSGRVSIASTYVRRARPARRWAVVDRRRSGVACGGTTGRAFRGPDDVWGNGRAGNLETACVDVLYAIAQEWSMLRGWLGRDGINGDGTGAPARVGWEANDAVWTGAYTAYGYSRDHRRTLTSLDIVGHENGHGVFATTPGGAVEGAETPAIAEATGDIFGTLTEAYADNPRDEPDYLIGEEASPAGSGALRDMADPASAGDPGCYTASISDAEEHAGAGPLDHWFALLAEGSEAAPTCNGGTVTGVGIRAAGEVFYQGLLLKTSAWDYADVRRATLIAAQVLDGGGCATYQQVEAAWNAVSVPARPGEPACATDGSSRGCTQVTRTGSVTERANSYQPWSRGFPANAGTVEGCLSGPPDADLDLYLQRYDAAAGVWSDVAESSELGSTESVSQVVEAGYYRWAVFGYLGGGSFTLGYDVP